MWPIARWDCKINDKRIGGVTRKLMTLISTFCSDATGVANQRKKLSEVIGTIFSFHQGFTPKMWVNKMRAN